MWPRLIIFLNPGIQVGLQLVDRTIRLLAERDTVELVEDGFVKALTDAVGLWALRLGARMIDVLDGEIKLIRPRCANASSNRLSALSSLPRLVSLP